MNAKGGDRIRVMSLGPYAATRVAGSPVRVWGQRIQDDWLGQRGKNGSARLSGTRKPQCRVWRGGEIRANCDLRNGRAPVLASTPRNPFDNPAVLGGLDECFELGRGRQCGYPIFDGFFLGAWPLD